jgi:hypothetical protein
VESGVKTPIINILIYLPAEASSTVTAPSRTLKHLSTSTVKSTCPEIIRF